MLKVIKHFINTEEKKRLLSNFFSLSVLQLLTYLLPLVTLPYLVRVLGIANFGLLSFATATAAYFNIIIDYGFNYTATREISIHRENKEKLIEIYSSVLSVKFILFIFSGVILSILVFSIERFYKDWDIFFLSFGVVFGQMLFPVWLFQGLENMKYITYLNIVSKTIFTLSIFIFIKEPNDYYMVPILNAIGLIIIGIWALILIDKKFKIKFKYQTKDIILYYFKDGWYIFVSNLASSLYTVTTMILLGFFANNITVGYYAVANKLINALKGLIRPISQALFPYFNVLANNSRTKVQKILKKLVLIFGGSMLLMSIFLFIFADVIIVLLFGSEAVNSILILKILSIIPFLVTLDTILGTLNMLVFKRNKEYSKIIVSAGLLNIILATVLIYLYSYIGAAIAVLIVESYISLRLLIYTQKSDLKI